MKVETHKLAGKIWEHRKRERLLLAISQYEEAFYGIDRGTHLLALVERLQAWADHDVQRIALSATIGNPEDLLHWIGGSSARPAALVLVARSADRVESSRSQLSRVAPRRGR